MLWASFPQTEHSFEDGKNRPALTKVLPYKPALYSNVAASGAPASVQGGRQVLDEVVAVVLGSVLGEGE
ncbi:hypothetical protein [Nonomuraea sp. NPDC049709]|uniref:hypothetical protein n=1 Tax=Nonomuraea sp. NPDC049709 TaxID=3154736 RepID=UPI0034381EA1